MLARRIVVYARPFRLGCGSIAGGSRSELRGYASIADKYAHKLKARAQREGLSGGNAVEALRAKYRARVRDQEQTRADTESAQTRPPVEKTDTQRPAATGTGATAQKSTPNASPHKTLASYMDVDKLRLHPAEEVSMLWRARFAGSENAICAVVPEDVYERLLESARRHPMFVLPLFRNGGTAEAEMHFLQWLFPARGTAHLVVTGLLEYKTRGEYARPHTVVMHHPELVQDKGLVLMNGDLTDTAALSPLQASWMMTALQRFYVPDDRDPTAGGRKDLLASFNRGDPEFDFSKVIDECRAVPGAGEV
ncbi:hypothetical protein PYCC9005_004884 [Savitreella phatthalungensis]